MAETKNPQAPEAAPAAPPAPAAAPATSAGDGSRLIITKLVLENFKSSANKKTIGPFHKCFNSIIGPNGSGKSNVIDAVLFVFGVRASKLRLKKVSELIHRSAQYPDFDHCRVDVHFVAIRDGPDGSVEEVPGTRTVVSRMAKRDNSSKYYVNGKGSTFKLVGELLRGHGIDLDNNRFLILQGEVELISQMKPKAQKEGETGMLEYLEEIIGSDRFVEPIREAAAACEVKEEERAQAKNRMKAAEKQKAGLEGAKAETEAFLEANFDLACRRQLLWNRRLADQRADASRHVQMAADLETKVAEAKAEMADDEARRQELEAEYKRLETDEEALAKELDTFKASYAAFERRDVKTREDLKHLKGERKKKKATVSRKRKQAEAHRTEAAELETLAAERQELIGRAAAKLQTVEGELEAMETTLKGKTEALRSELEEARAEAEPMCARTNAARAALEETRAEIAMVRGRSEEARARYADASQALEAARATLAGHGDAVAELRASRDAKAERLETAQAELKEAELEEKQTAAEATELRARREECAAAMNASSSRSGMLAALLNAKRPGGALASCDLVGRLGDLGAIDEAYDVAISTACPALNYLVTETVDGAQQCIEFLRRHKLGRATFVVLEKIQHLAERGLVDAAVKTPRGCPRLFDLVQPADDRFRVAFYYALRDTLVADDIDAAYKVAYKGRKCVWRVVTRSGEMIEKSGVMSGGGGRPRRGLMGSSVAAAAAAAGSKDMDEGPALAAQVEEISAALRATTKRRDQARDRRRNLTREIRGLQALLKKINTKLSKMELDLAAAEGSIPDLEATIQELQGQLDVSGDEEARLAELGTLVGQHEAAFEEAQAASSALEGRVDELQKMIMDVGGPELKKRKAKVAKYQKLHQEGVASQQKAEVDIAAFKEKAIAADADAAAAEEELEELLKQAQQLKDEFATITQEAEQVMDSFDRVKALREERQGELRAARTAYGKHQKSMQGRLQKVEDLGEQLDETRREIEICKRHELVWIEKLEQLSSLMAAAVPNEDEEEDGEAAAEDDSEEADEEQRALPELSPEDVAEVDVEATEVLIGELENKVAQLRKKIDMGAIREYRRVEREWRRRAGDFNAATAARDAMRLQFEELRKQRLSTFMAGFQVITLKLKEMYQMITLGGDAELELVDTLDPFAEGIVFSVRPRGKSWKNIANLSGGEKTLSSLALVFALHHYKPTPLYVMDEIDAALDYRNVSIVANYIKERTRNAQFIIISLRNNMFELADRLVGIYKTNDATKSVAINPGAIAARTLLRAPGTTAKNRAAPAAAPLAEVTNSAEGN